MGTTEKKKKECLQKSFLNCELGYWRNISYLDFFKMTEKEA